MRLFFALRCVFLHSNVLSSWEKNESTRKTVEHRNKDSDVKHRCVEKCLMKGDKLRKCIVRFFANFFDCATFDTIFLVHVSLFWDKCPSLACDRWCYPCSKDIFGQTYTPHVCILFFWDGHFVSCPQVRYPPFLLKCVGAWLHLQQHLCYLGCNVQSFDEYLPNCGLCTAGAHLQLELVAIICLDWTVEMTVAFPKVRQSSGPFLSCGTPTLFSKYSKWIPTESQSWTNTTVLNVWVETTPDSGCLVLVFS